MSITPWNVIVRSREQLSDGKNPKIMAWEVILLLKIKLFPEAVAYTAAESADYHWVEH